MYVFVNGKCDKIHRINFFLAANYNPDEDEYLTKHSKGFNELHFDTHDRPICDQPGRPEKIIR